MAVKLLVADRVSDADAVDESDGVCVADRLADTLAVSLRVCDDEGVPVRVPDELPVGVRVCELLAVSLRVWDAEEVPVRLADVLHVGVRVSDEDGVAVAATAAVEAVARSDQVNTTSPGLLDSPQPVSQNGCSRASRAGRLGW